MALSYLFVMQVLKFMRETEKSTIVAETADLTMIEQHHLRISATLSRLIFVALHVLTQSLRVYAEIST